MYNCNTRKKKKDEPALISLTDKQLKNRIIDMMAEWPCPLNRSEHKALYNIMWNSVVGMKLKCMTPKQRSTYRDNNRKKKEAKIAVEAQLNDRHSHLRVHHIEV